MYKAFESKGYQVVKDRNQMISTVSDKPILGGAFSDGALPYTKDTSSSAQLSKSMPSLAEMTQKAISVMKNNKNGFALQVEAGKSIGRHMRMILQDCYMIKSLLTRR